MRYQRLLHQRLIKALAMAATTIHLARSKTLKLSGSYMGTENLIGWVLYSDSVLVPISNGDIQLLVAHCPQAGWFGKIRACSRNRTFFNPENHLHLVLDWDQALNCGVSNSSVVAMFQILRPEGSSSWPRNNGTNLVSSVLILVYASHSYYHHTLSGDSAKYLGRKETKRQRR